MKAFMYISRATNPGSAPWMPYDYVSLLNVSRKYNTENEITGFLSYQDGHFFQYVEGPTDKVEPLMVKVANDSRHTGTHVLVSRKISTRSFSNWSMPIGNKLMNDERFVEFAESYHKEFAHQSDEHKRILEGFHVFKFLERSDGTILSHRKARRVSRADLDMDMAV